MPNDKYAAERQLRNIAQVMAHPDTSFMTRATGMVLFKKIYSELPKQEKIRLTEAYKRK